MSQPFVHIDRIRLFSSNGEVYRAFHHLIASRVGTLLLVPLHLVVGRCDVVVDGCPVPWEEAFAVLEYPATHPLGNPEWNDHAQQLQYLGIAPDSCEMDHIAPMTLGREKVLRLVHPSGVRYAVVMT
jgi:hypothetical protein